MPGATATLRAAMNKPTQRPQTCYRVRSHGMTTTELQSDQIQTENQELRRKLVETEQALRVLEARLQKAATMLRLVIDALTEERRANQALREEVTRLSASRCAF